MHYRHFLMESGALNHITLKESTNLISNGSTGLCSWQVFIFPKYTYTYFLIVFDMHTLKTDYIFNQALLRLHLTGRFSAQRMVR